MTRRHSMVFLSLRLLAFVTILNASDAAFAWDQGPCKDDTKKYCNVFQKHEGGLKKCLKDNTDKLSQGCKDHLGGAVKNKVMSAKAACSGDIAKLCATSSPIGGGIKKCLTENVGKLSAECKTQVESGKGPW